MADYWKLLLPDMMANCNYKITSYGSALKNNKERLRQSI